ncbi:TetR/AcrR family transcriptional regulator [Nanchangia anserum]|uniref:TetR/AcrR family transcriptional regulator n=1 Tax=Nanchangia anserum TaxID=2692125 RepID=A0A8I0GBC4_9ACTO|nr:TetR/AcrR family transcriptional regulator [Nanchangia anserum]MBD3689653.1 TetR/AcrR family transcriptional regulator [Nanchangia anserum]QOX81834.1 TetR/AcrR family transcriptional regulator [Nanchangia anserum]
MTNTLGKILMKAREAFVARGYSGASFREIAREAGVTTGAIYGYVSGKDALFRLVVDEEWQRVHTYYRHVVADNAERHEAAMRALADPEIDVDTLTAQTAILVEDNERILKVLMEHRDIALLVLTNSRGSSLENVVDILVDDDVYSIVPFIERTVGHPLSEDEKNGVRVLTRATVNLMITVLESYTTFEEARVSVAMTNAYFVGAHRGLFLQMAREHPDSPTP